MSKNDKAGIRTWATDDRTPMRTLSSLLFDPDPLLAWRAVESLGKVAAIVANDNIELVKRQLRSLLWLMNDESGGVCWNAPEAIGEIIHNVPSQMDEFGIILPAFFKEEPFERGSRWAVARIAPIKPDSFLSAIPELEQSLNSEDIYIKAFSIMALKAIGKKSDDSFNQKLVDDQSLVTIYDYDSGELKELSISQIASG